MLDAFERSLEGHRFWMLADYARHSWATDEVKREVKSGGVRGFVEQLTRMKGHGPDDEETVARFAELARFPEGSWGARCPTSTPDTTGPCRGSGARCRC